MVSPLYCVHNIRTESNQKLVHTNIAFELVISRAVHGPALKGRGSDKKNIELKKGHKGVYLRKFRGEG